MGSSDDLRLTTGRTVLVTDVMAWSDLVQGFLALVETLLPELGHGAILDVQRINMSEEQRRSQVPLTAAALQALANDLDPRDEHAFLWTEVRAFGPNGVVLLCNDFDLHVESGVKSVIELARAWLRTAGLAVHESRIDA